MKTITHRSLPYVEYSVDECQKIFNDRFLNRPFKMSRAKRYANAMTNGDWIDETRISFYNGQLDDGQHRMFACILAQRPFRGYVLRHDDPKLFSTMDCGDKRTNSDALAVEQKKNTTTLASALKVLESIHRKHGLRHGVGGVTVRIEPYEIMAIHKKYPDIDYSASLIHSHIKHFRYPTGSATALHYLLRKREIGVQNTEGLDSPLADKFMIEHLMKGYGLYEGHPCATFRGYAQKCLGKEVPGIDRLSHQQMIHGGIMAWNKWVKGKTMKRIKIPNVSELPKILLP